MQIGPSCLVYCNGNDVLAYRLESLDCEERRSVGVIRVVVKVGRDQPYGAVTRSHVVNDAHVLLTRVGLAVL